ncbi:MATE family efflux transporter [Bifidobacterium eulemuris]|uniref:Probable multidrug resistance protein NorM n=1 Tax=Bifidobacterium eulemuris TaxID=1765219 RepID=A0A261GDX4_9BIFI|nr:MATE family efflux transporter [Bifidobacterium eulemuris]OZG69325.1 MATE family efflux transporter [Bifidobacterium eulemuris]QOL31178.1 MATE family efflux transporter [Bifidobacterium eulemuris]
MVAVEGERAVETTDGKNGQGGKSAIDMLHGPIWNRVLMFALPVAATGILEQLFNATGVAIVGNFSGGEDTQAVAAVGANSFIVMLVINFFIGVSLGANVVIANAIGRGSMDGVRKAVHTAIVMAVAGGVAALVIGELGATAILGMLNVPADVYPLALLYLRIYLIGLPVILLYNFEAAIFRSVGDTATPLKVLAMAGVLNVALGLTFTAGLNMSVAGVATATVLSNAFGSLVLLRLLVRTDAPIHVDLRELRVDMMAMRSILRIGLPAGIQGAVFAFANVIIQGAINSLGTTVIAASSAAFNIEVFAYQVLNSFAQACSTFTGQNYGARQVGRCRRVLAICYLEDVVATAAAITLVLLFGRSLLMIFVHDPEAVDIGYIRLTMVFIGYIFSMAYEMASGYLRGFGISLVPALLTVLGVCGTRIGWVMLVFPSHRSFESIMLVYPISLAVTAALVLGSLIVYLPSRRMPAR